MAICNFSLISVQYNGISSTNIERVMQYIKTITLRRNHTSSDVYSPKRRCIKKLELAATIPVPLRTFVRFAWSMFGVESECRNVQIIQIEVFPCLLDGELIDIGESRRLHRRTRKVCNSPF